MRSEQFSSTYLLGLEIFRSIIREVHILETRNSHLCKHLQIMLVYILAQSLQLGLMDKVC